VRIRDANSATGAALDNHFVAGLGELTHAFGYESDPIFLNLDFSRHTYSHCTLPVFDFERAADSALQAMKG
jgi:hypothetical protein